VCVCIKIVAHPEVCAYWEVFKLLFFLGGDSPSGPFASDLQTYLLSRDQGTLGIDPIPPQAAEDHRLHLVQGWLCVGLCTSHFDCHGVPLSPRSIVGHVPYPSDPGPGLLYDLPTGKNSVCGERERQAETKTPL
jgi:hypothetical protein